MTEKIKYISLEGWQANEQWIRNYIDAKDAASIKSAGISTDGKKLYFYKIATPSSDTAPAFEIELPSPDLDAYVRKIMNATAGHVAVVNADGTYRDGGVALTALAKSADVSKEIAEKISQSSHMKKELVTALPSAAKADNNTFYLIKINSVSGKDKYEIWTKIGDELVLIDDTSLDLSGYVNQTALASQLAALKKEAVDAATAAAATDAANKAKQTLSDAKAYTDSKTNPLTTKVSTLENNVAEIKSNITTINSTISSQGDRIHALETEMDRMEVATNDELLTIFNSIFYPTA